MASVARARVDRSASDLLRSPGIVLGVGLGGFIDGIALHQILQWHHMLTSSGSSRLDVDAYPATTVHGLEINTIWDGLFHVFTWLAVLAGLALLYSRTTHNGQRVWSSKPLWGWILVGWGLFNVIEGIVDHHILGIHHVRSGPDQALWDVGFLILGAALIIGGWLLQRTGQSDRAEIDAS